MARQPKPRIERVCKTVSLPLSMVNDLDIIARRSGRTIAQVIESLVREGIMTWKVTQIPDDEIKAALDYETENVGEK